MIKVWLKQIEAQVMNLPIPARITGGLLLGLWLVVATTIFLKITLWWFGSSQQSAHVEPRIAQIQGYLDAQDRLEVALAERDQLLDEVAFPDSGDSGRGGALLQQEIRRMSGESGLTVVGSEVLEPEPLDALLQLRVKVKVTGSPAGVTEFMTRLNRYRPFLFVEGFSLYGQRQVNGRVISGVQQTENSLMLELDVLAHQVTTPS